MTDTLKALAEARRAGKSLGMTSVCTAHPIVIEAALLHAGAHAGDVLIEGTCNQVNQEGGYTGMDPLDFRDFVRTIADRVGFDRNRLILGGDHLGPNPWTDLPSSEAMARAKAMVDAYVRAGFTKLHLDTSMPCLGEGPALAEETIAERAADLAAVAERAANDGEGGQPVYVIGTEVPPPGGALETIDALAVTRPEAVLRTVDLHREAFAERGLEAAFARVIAVVVQPGVEFGNANVVAYRREAARDLTKTLSRVPQLVFEAHSTDYQDQGALSALVEDGFAILKVGPALTFALREALYGLDRIAEALRPAAVESLPAAMEDLMLREPGHWRKYYHGDSDEQRVQRHFSYSDRIRYYWPHPDARAAAAGLEERLGGDPIPETLVSQYLPGLYPAVRSGELLPTARSLQLAAVRRVLEMYREACRPR